MYEWQQKIQQMIDEIDNCIRLQDNEALTLRRLSEGLGYSEYFLTRKFQEITGMQFRDYLRQRRVAFALKEVRDSTRGLLEIALDYGFSSHEAFTRAFKDIYGITPSEYRRHPRPLILRTKLNPFNRYFLGIGSIPLKQQEQSAAGQRTMSASQTRIGGMHMSNTMKHVNIYFTTIPAHKFLYIKSYESNSYWDFWQKQAQLGNDCATICGLLDSIQGKLDDQGSSEPNSGGGQIMAYLHDPQGKPFCYGVPRAECYGVRLPVDYQGEVPPQMFLADIPEGDYIVFEHGPFDYEQENAIVEERVDAAIAAFDYAGTGYCFDDSPGRIAYFYHDPSRFWKYIRPVRKESAPPLQATEH